MELRGGEKMKGTLKIVEKSKIWFTISIIITLIGIGAWVFRGLNFGIDFKGGTVITIQMNNKVSNTELDDIRVIASKYDPQALVQEVEGNQITVRGDADKINANNIPELHKEIKDKYKLGEQSLISTDTIGPSVGKELRNNAIWASMAAVIGILAYVSFRFEYKMGIAAIIALVHDVFITLSVYSLFFIPVNSPFIAAMLTILGYSINDTIVVFDRIRENRNIGKYKDNAELVNVSITQTLIRSLNTGVSTLITITIMYIIGVSAIKEFAAPLIIGIISGTYSSIFIASPLWVIFENKKKLA